MKQIELEKIIEKDLFNDIRVRDSIGIPMRASFKIENSNSLKNLKSQVG